ncbi:MAG: hypothetical protein Q7T50_05625 [Candidatus Magasanikbacteria bacterium]|nr:hypothetical protein [Candidatus Magasanikbacteria bacterium]
MSLKKFEYRGYNCTIYPGRITFKALPDNPIGEILPDLNISSSNDNLEIRKKLAEKIIDKYCWEFLGEFNGLKISTRFSPKGDIARGWIVQVISCQKKDKEGEIISERKSRIISGFLSPVNATNAALIFARRSEKNW